MNDHESAVEPDDGDPACISYVFPRTGPPSGGPANCGGV